MDVFFSYSHEDTEIVTVLANDFEQHGITTWIADRDVRPGDSWRLETTDALRRARSMLLLLSKYSERSIYAAKEWGYFLAENKPILVVRLGEASIADRDLGGLRWMSFRDEPHLSEGRIYIRERMSEILAQVNRDSLQLGGLDFLTSENLSNSLLPYLNALTDLQHTVDLILDRELSKVYVRRISQQSPITIDLSGFAEAVKILRDVIVPWRREHLKRMARYEEQQKELELHERSARNRLLELQLQIAEQIVHEVNPNASSRDIAINSVRLLPSLRVLTESPLDPIQD